MLLADDLNQLLDVLPKYISDNVKKSPNCDQLIEIVLDIGRRPEARYANGTEYLSYKTVVWQDLDYILKRLGKFSGDNRAGIEKTLHRISSLRNRNRSVKPRRARRESRECCSAKDGDLHGEGRCSVGGLG